MGVLSLPQESKEEKRMREREAGVVRKTNPFRGVCVRESFLSVLLCFCFINFFIIIIITIFLFSFFFFDFDLVLVFFLFFYFDFLGNGCGSRWNYISVLVCLGYSFLG